MNKSKDKAILGKYTEKEIYEIPLILKKVIEQKNEIQRIAQIIKESGIRHIYLIGAGSSYHAGFAMNYLFNRITKIPTYTEFSMEFQYLIKPILKKDDCVIGISQSGETSDTIDSIKIAKDLGCLTIAITNNTNSNLSKITDCVIGLGCGEEISVLATKTYVAQLTLLSMLSLEISHLNKSITSEEYDSLWGELRRIPDKIHSTLPILHKKVINSSYHFKFVKFCFILGSGPDYATAMEGSLKLKEGARIFGQAYSTAEFPHGPITLADSDTCIIAIIPQERDSRKNKLLNLLERIKERKATILAIYESLDENIHDLPFDIGLQVPDTSLDLQPLVMILAIQLLTLEIARVNGLNPDEPKFLKKVSNI
ncbi:MAG: SIS domain-containing protein [Candidatus Lokiarchaeota archaeon]|nr:SIS domain-containing protein [Candidatus Lokiarchaeota archaeon]